MHVMLFVALSIFYNMNATEFIYPVAHNQQANQLVVIYQKSLHDIELWFWDYTQHCAIKGLSSFSTPVNVQMLPSGNGFSFIDDGYIKIKEFTKRSPITLPIYEPIGLFSHMQWIDDEIFYFVARQGDYFHIFTSTIHADIKALTYGAFDALYPQKIDSQLFYIQRDTNHRSSIIAQPWQTNDAINNQAQQSCEILLGPTKEQICCLHMINNQEGFYLQAPRSKKEGCKQSYEFICYHLQKIQSVWQHEKLCSFTIPAQYLTGSDRLYESIECFVPWYDTENQAIFFISWQEGIEQGQLFELNLITKHVQYCNQVLDQHYLSGNMFAPYKVDNHLYCGLIINDEVSRHQLQKSFDIFSLHLPCYQR